MKRFVISSLALGAVAAACTGSHGDTDRTEEATTDVEVASAVSQPLYKDSARVLNIVAHQDDDFFNMSPDMWNNVAGGRAVQSIVFTAGDAGLCQQYVVDRGTGQKLAFERMANVNYGGNWVVTEPIVAGHKVRKETMPAHDLSIVYIGLTNNDAVDLERLWNDLGSTLRVNTRDTRLAGVSYNRNELVDVVKQLILNFAPTHVNTMDSGKTWPIIGFPSEHTDHVHGALFALAAMQKMTTQPSSIRLYRTYNSIFDDDNVSAVDAANKHQLYLAYQPYDPYLCEGAFSSICGGLTECQNPAHLVYGLAETRQYPIWTLNGVTGPLRAPGTNQCLRANGNTAGSTLSIGSCATNLQKWSLPTDGTLRYNGLCVSSNTGSDLTPTATRGATLRLEACNAAANRQRFLLTGQTQLRGPDATCVDSTTPGTLKLLECSDAATMLGFNANFAPPAAAATNGTDYASVTNSEQYYRSLTYGDLDGDGDADVCIRRADGVYCSTNNAGVFQGYSRRTTAFRDTDGYGTASTGSTLQLADVDSDGKADLCARKGGLFDSGLYCAKNTGTGAAFNAATKRTNGSDFSDLYGFDSGDVYYRNIRLVDVNGDNRPDVCARNTNGIECATNNGSGSFAVVSQRENVEFRDDLGWTLSSAGATVHFADIDGDGKNDVCGRGSAGMICMLGTGSTTVNAGFERAHLWSDTGDFSDSEGWNGNVAYYGSIRLGDINGDGRADVCGRKADGVWCGLSTGQAFSPAKLMVPSDPFGDANYGSAQYATSLSLVRLDAGAHADLCLRGPLTPTAGTGLRCYIAP